MRRGKLGLLLVGIFGALVVELIGHTLRGFVKHFPGKYDDERIN